MGNCQATADVVGVLLEHPDGRAERLYWSVSARQLMLQYPGNYVALVHAPVLPDQPTQLRVASKKLKLLPPDAMLQIGQRYRLVSFEDVLLELSEQKVMGRSASTGARSKRVYSEQTTELSGGHQNNDENVRSAGRANVGGSCAVLGPTRSMSFSRSGQWRPALQSISELGR